MFEVHEHQCGADEVADSAGAELPAGARKAVEAPAGQRAREPFCVPSADTPVQLSLGVRKLAAAEVAGALIRVVP